MGEPSTQARYKPKRRRVSGEGRPRLFGNKEDRVTLNVYMDRPMYEWLVRKSNEESALLPGIVDGEHHRPAPGARKRRVGYGEIIRRALREFMEKEDAARQTSNGKHEGHARHVNQAAKAAVQAAHKGITPRVR